MKQWRGFITGMLTTILLVALTGIAVASTGSKEAVLTYRNIKITLDGVEVIPKDVNGGVVEPFIVDGITYLPVRGIANFEKVHITTIPTTVRLLKSRTLVPQIFI